MLLEVQRVCKTFQNHTRALTDVSFSVGEGEFVSVIGPSGAGKTTLFRILNGSDHCDSGAIVINGVHFEAAGRRIRRSIQTAIGTIYQLPVDGARAAKQSHRYNKEKKSTHDGRK